MEVDHSYTATCDEATPDPALETPRHNAGRIDALNYVSSDHPLLPPPRARSIDSMVGLRSRVRYHAAFWWDVFLVLQQNKNPEDYRASQAEVAKLRQENDRLVQKICQLRQQGYKDRATIDYLASSQVAQQSSDATSLVADQAQRTIDASVKERKRKRERITHDRNEG